MQLAMALRAMVRLLIGGELMSTLGGGSRGGGVCICSGLSGKSTICANYSASPKGWSVSI